MHRHLLNTLQELLTESGRVIAPVAELRARAGVFGLDAALLEMARLNLIGLSKHDYPASLTDEQRAQLITDGTNYFNAIWRIEK